MYTRVKDKTLYKSQLGFGKLYTEPGNKAIYCGLKHLCKLASPAEFSGSDSKSTLSVCVCEVRGDKLFRVHARFLSLHMDKWIAAYG